MNEREKVVHLSDTDSVIYHFKRTQQDAYIFTGKNGKEIRWEAPPLGYLTKCQCPKRSKGRVKSHRKLRDVNPKGKKRAIKVYSAGQPAKAKKSRTWGSRMGQAL